MEEIVYEPYPGAFDHLAIFIREEGFYPIQFMDPAVCGKTMAQQAADHAELNPGTMRVEDVEGNILWRVQ